MKLIENALPPPEFERRTVNTPIYDLLIKKRLGKWIKIKGFPTHNAAKAKRNNMLMLVKRDNPLGTGYGITTAIRPADDGTFTLSVCKIARETK